MTGSQLSPSQKDPIEASLCKNDDEQNTGRTVNHWGVNSPQLAAQNPFPFPSPSFPHAFSGNPGETLTGPPIKTLGVTRFGKMIIKLS